MDNTKALNSYIVKLALAEELTKRIAQFINDHGEVSPEDVSWADCGSMQHVIDQLNQVVNFINNEEE